MKYFSIKAKISDKSIVLQIIVIKTPFLIIGVTRADLDHSGKMSDAEEESKCYVCEGKKNLDNLLKVRKGWDQGRMTSLIMHPLAVDCEAFKLTKNLQ